MKKVNKIKEASKDVKLMRLRRISMLKNKARKKYYKIVKQCDCYNTNVTATKFVHIKANLATRSFTSKLMKLGVKPLKFSKEEIEEIKRKALTTLNKWEKQ